MENIEIFISAGGQVLNKVPQQKWRGDKTLQTAPFAGQLMTLGEAEDGADGFELIYLGYKSNSFQTEEIAKEAAPKFVINVLQKMISSVQTD